MAFVEKREKIDHEENHENCCLLTRGKGSIGQVLQTSAPPANADGSSPTQPAAASAAAPSPEMPRWERGIELRDTSRFSPRSDVGRTARGAENSCRRPKIARERRAQPGGTSPLRHGLCCAVLRTQNTLLPSWRDGTLQERVLKGFINQFHLIRAIFRSSHEVRCLFDFLGIQFSTELRIFKDESQRELNAEHFGQRTATRTKSSLSSCARSYECDLLRFLLSTSAERIAGSYF